VERPWL